MSKIGRIHIFIFHCVICSQLYVLCMFYAQIIITFYVYLLPATNNRFIKVIKYDLFERMLPKFSPFFNICMPKTLMLKPRTINVKSNVVLVFIRIYKYCFSFQDIATMLKFSRKLAKTLTPKQLRGGRSIWSDSLGFFQKLIF